MTVFFLRRFIAKGFFLSFSLWLFVCLYSLQ